MSQRSQLSVITPASSYDLISLSDVKSDWGITSTADDAFLSRTITRASAAAAQFCNRVFPAEMVVETIFVERDVQPFLNYGGVDPLVLKRYPIGTIASIVEGVGTAVTVLDPASDFTVDQEKGWIIRLDSTGNPKNWKATQFVVTYTGGYTSIPYDIQDAISRMVWTRYAERSRDPFIQRQRIYGVEEVEYIKQSEEGNLSSDVSDILDNYRVPVSA